MNSAEYPSSIAAMKCIIYSALLLSACSPQQPVVLASTPIPENRTEESPTNTPASIPTAVELDCSSALIADPAAIYCTQILGYPYEISDTSAGQQGLCVLPDGNKCDVWEFYSGKCGEMYSYCWEQGYSMRTMSSGADPYAREYAVCVDSNDQIVGSVAELSGLKHMLTDCSSQ